MKIFKYVSVFVAFAAMSLTFMSCDRDNDITGDPMADHTNGDKQDYWIDFTLIPGDLSEKAQARFVELKDTTIYGEKLIKVIEHPMYVTYDYAMEKFNKVAALPDSINDIVQKIMIPTFCVDTVGDVCHDGFEVTMTLSKDSMKTSLATFTWKAKTAFDGPAIIAKNKK